jgi:hypothetical protein
LYNTTRDVPFTRPSIILPQSIYFERTRNLTVSADGGEIYARALRRGGTLFGELRLRAAADRYRCCQSGSGRLESPGSLDSKLAPDFQVLYEGPAAGIGWAFTALRLDLRYKPGFGDRSCWPASSS